MKQGFAIKWAGVALGVAGLGACVNLGGGAKAPAQLFELSPAMTWAPGTTLSAAPGAAAGRSRCRTAKAIFCVASHCANCPTT